MSQVVKHLFSTTMYSPDILYISLEQENGTLDSIAAAPFKQT